MEKRGFAFALLTIVLLSGGTVYAQKAPTSSLVPSTPAPALSTLNVEKILNQVSATNIQSDGQDTSFLQVVSDFLQLQPPQVNELQQLLQARQAALTPLFAASQSLSQQLGVLLQGGGNPLQVGALVIHIYALQQQMGQVQQTFVASFVSLLDPDQLQRLQAVQIAIRVQPVLPAFQPIFLF